jgi:CDP-paratose 2-epimerase
MWGVVPENTMSIWAEFGPILAELLGRPVPVTFAAWRPGDQRVYVSDIRKAQLELNWKPQVTVRDGITRLYEWIRDNQQLFDHL